MERYPATIRIRGLQSADGEENVTETFSQGTLALSDDRIYLSYNETIEGTGEVSSLLTLSRRKMTLMRKGSIHTKMEFDPGRMTETEYDMPDGSLRFSLRTLRFFVSEYELQTLPQTLSAEAEYELVMGDSALSRNRLDIHIEVKA